MLKQVTKIEIQKKRKNRCSIFLNDEFAFGLDHEVVYKFGLKKGDQLSDKDIKKILVIEERKKAKDRALRLIAHRDRSEKEIIDKLRRIGYENSIIEWVIDELKRMKLIDDARFAISFAMSKMITKPMGEHLLRRELLNKGINEENMAQAIEKAYQEHDQIFIAAQLAKKQMKKYKGNNELKAKKRISDFLLRRGFSWDIVIDIVERLDS